MLHADENHPIWDMIRKYNKLFDGKYMIGTMSVATTGDKLLPFVVQAIETNTPITLDNKLVYPPLPDGYEI